VAAFGPVMGPAMPNLIWAMAVSAMAIEKPSIRPSVVILFIVFSLQVKLAVAIEILRY
jgi:hypothetical protein